MDAIEVLKTRRSCRIFVGQVPDDALKIILDCALNAPCAHNLQDVKIVVVQDPVKIQTFNDLNKCFWESEVDPFYGAPTVCFVFAPEENQNGFKDGALAIGAMQTAAWALGIGSCWINRCTEMFETDEGKMHLESWGLEGHIGIGCCLLGKPGQTMGPKAIKPNRIIVDKI
ncbi:MAG: nitroreductase family protein [Phascolarctobacterium sp.]|nr:nitroreductase family protein [Phascolarctobacterium sp.]